MNLKGSGLAESHHGALELPRRTLNLGTVELLLGFRMPIELRWSIFPILEVSGWRTQLRSDSTGLEAELSAGPTLYGKDIL
ncbi:hypothetical protein BHYA_0064g00100 [Botrytis hyacinthi]|uniref:Uncharacterized protein n=1 Tax=Botrytis hyacinthi TaxID=278943 RepID=A0A4Z1GPS0_9HELO|nr:hypothetical protein BHYA_0064g00100 [Botrytis hyacinthi]